MQWHDWSSMNPKGPISHLSLSPCSRFPVAARIKFKTLMLAYRTATGSAPSYFHSLMRIYIPSRSLRSASERRLVVPSQRGTKSLSRTFSFTVPGWWNELPTPIGMLNPWQFSSNTWKLISSVITWLHLCFPSLTSPCLASIYSEQCLKLCIASTSCSILVALQNWSWEIQDSRFKIFICHIHDYIESI